ncbi:MAG: class I SAM-dependent methyltransferase [Brevibacillus sp.]|nr:class I SAM-dependent methyltransferase [Brevibacillus sp.]
MRCSDGPNFFDQEHVFQAYWSHRELAENANDTLEKPIFMELLGSPHDLSILDLGCGDARFGRDMHLQGCRRYVGVDGSANMIIRAAENLRNTSSILIHQRLEEWRAEGEHYDLVTSRLALHYIEDLRPLFQQVYASLVPGGRFLFSVEHPVITSSSRSSESGKREDWIVDDYFVTGERIVNWLGQRVKKYHRTIEDFFVLLREAGFLVESLRESEPQPSLFMDKAEYRRRRRIPLFLFMCGRKACK